LTNRKISLKASFEAQFICWGLNNLLPAKLGEIGKTIFLKKIYSYNLGTSFSQTIIERFMDVFVLFLLSLISLNFFEIDNKTFIYIGIFLFVSLVVFYISILNVKFFIKMVNFYLPKKIAKFSSQMLKVFARISTKDIALLFIFTLLLWGSQYISILCFFSFGTDWNLSYIEILLVFLAISLSFALPSTPASFGVLQGAVIFALSFANISKESALASGIIIQLIQFIPTVLMTIYILIKYNISMKFLQKESL
jgi:hypothetical protein